VTAMEFGLLGPLVVRRDGIVVPIKRGNQRTLLAALLLDANQVVSTDQIAETLWGPNLPPSAQVTIRNYVRRLRQALGDGGRDRIRAEPNGYLISARSDELDLTRFEDLLGSARAAARDGSWGSAAAAAGSALALWRGTPFADVQSDALTLREGTRLAEMRLLALETRIQADLHLGRHADVTAELQRLAAAHPLREQLHMLLMLALYRCGRQGEALVAYHDARRLLAEELGVEPGPALQDLQQRILAADPTLSPPESSPPSGESSAEPSAETTTQTGRPPAVVPRQLPRAAVQFVGRAGELAALTALLDHADTRAPGTAVISAIGGTAGVGKTALAVHWAHLMAGLFPGGQLYVNLRGFDPSGTPVTPEEAIRGFLYALGVPADQVPPGLDTQAGLYRSLLQDRRVLILLDNARDEQQVRPLFPASSGCMVVITSRNQLTGLAATDDARLLTLNVLSVAEARQLLVGRVGEDRSAADSNAVSEIADVCARLPLALAVATARAADRPQMPVATLAAELRDVVSRLDALDTGDPAVSIRAVFSWSYRQLSPPTAQMFRLLGLHPGPDISAAAAASLAGIPPGQGRQVFGELVRAGLISENAPGRYTFHDLLRAYAAEQARGTDTDAQRQAATGRVLDHYLHTADAAALLIRPSHQPAITDPPRPGVTAEHLATREQALAWFETEHRVLLSAVVLADETRLDTCAWQLPWAMAEYLLRRGHWHDWAATQRIAVEAATRLGNKAAQSLACRQLGHACAKLGGYAEAQAHLARSLRLIRELGDRAAEARVHQILGWIAEQQGQNGEIVSQAEQALALFRAAGHRAGQAEALNALGWGYLLLGEIQRARVLCRQAIDLNHELGNPTGEAASWDSLGYAELQIGSHEAAAYCYQQTLRLFRDTGNRAYEADALIHLGDARGAAGDRQGAETAWQQAIAILEDMQHPEAEQVRARLATAAGDVPREPETALSVPRQR
jgi:DNA-binding SARP family transcriptional activator